ncbi:MAG: sigma-54-dependent Fis family transcriptional regulator [Alistipes sp.]|nr:sigma-54-dependent Fis family transcriptional regulator [Alistipes sp.]
MTKILLVEHSKSVRNNLRERLEFEGIATDIANDGAAAAELCRAGNFDLMLIDDIEPLPEAEIPMIVLSTTNSLDGAIDALHKGAIDFITRPIDMNRLLTTIRRTTATDGDRETTRRSAATPRHVRRSAAHSSTTIEPIVGDSEAIRQVRRLIDKVAPSEARILVTGENGTGKELVARWLHAKSRRAEQPFVEINCAAIPSELIESELFGHERGAFTSAIKQRKGKFEQANGGTLFMDEIGDMSAAAQAKVLRALQERKISRVGSDRDIEVDVRIIAATNKNLREEIAAGRFREDLYHRLSVIIIGVPPLRERRGDIPLLVEHFIEQISQEEGVAPKPIEKCALERLTMLDWSGNVRELRNVVERLMVLSGDTITLDDIEQYCQ